MTEKGRSGRVKSDPDFMFTPGPIAGLYFTDKRITIVGGTGGLGRAIARLAAQLGAAVTVVGRTFRDSEVNGISFQRADLSSMVEARRIGNELLASEIDVLILTNGIFAAQKREVTEEGIERDIAVSFLSRLVILRTLCPRLQGQHSTTPRVFIMGYPGTGLLGDPSDLNAEENYKAMAVHGNMVAGNEALVLDAAHRYRGIEFYGLNPGIVSTNIRANYIGEGSLRHRLIEGLIGLLTRTPDAYANLVVPLLFAPELTGRSGAMFSKRGTPILPSKGLSQEYVATFLDASETLVDSVLQGTEGLG